jgi:hypothetical protein
MFQVWRAGLYRNRLIVTRLGVQTLNNTGEKIFIRVLVLAFAPIDTGQTQITGQDEDKQKEQIIKPGELASGVSGSEHSDH